MLRDRFCTFIYSERQSDIAGTDGETTFNRVFGEAARLVVVLYRDAWGETSWTRIEKTAIQNRALKDGYDFVKLISLDGPSSVPKWLPKTQLWIGMDRFGLIGAASVIESRAQELGGEVAEESARHRAARFARETEFESSKARFHHSSIGVNTALTEFQKLKEGAESAIRELNTSGSVSLVYQDADNEFTFGGLGISLSVRWRCRFNNSLNESSLTVDVWVGDPLSKGSRYLDEPKRLRKQSFHFAALSENRYGWIPQQAVTDLPYVTADLAAYLIKVYFDEAEKYRRAKK